MINTHTNKCLAILKHLLKYRKQKFSNFYYNMNFMFEDFVLKQIFFSIQ